MKIKASLIGLFVVMMSAGIVNATEQPGDQPISEGEVGYYFFPAVKTAPPRFVMREDIHDQEMTVEEALQKKCPGAKLISMTPVGGGTSFSPPTFAISFTMPKQKCVGS